MSEGDPRKGMFHQRRVIAGDTACSVNGVLPKQNMAVLINKPLKTTKIKDKNLQHLQIYGLFQIFVV